MMGGRMALRATIGTLAAAAACLAFAGGGAAPARAAETCTWGGTPAAPTGTFTLRPGITNTPSTGPHDFRAIGDLAGGPSCTGKLIYDGEFDAGSTCLVATFHARVKGLPGIVWAEGTADNVVPAPALLYDAHGNVVGIEVAQIVTEDNIPHYTDCTTPEGFTVGSFSSIVELF
jgi:hypothetical protein